MSHGGATKQAAALTLIALFVFYSVPRVYAHHYRRHESSRRPLDVANNSLIASCDLDADLTPDRLTLHANGQDRTIRIRFSDARSWQVSFTARTDAPGNLIIRDIDHDGDVDLVWVGTADQQSAVVLLNNGEGNFVEATDNSPFASELDELFGNSDPSGKLKLKRGRKSSTLTSASFHEVGLPVFTRFPSITIIPAPVSIEPQVIQSPLAGHVRKRGPPVVLS